MKFYKENKIFYVPMGQKNFLIGGNNKNIYKYMQLKVST